MMSVLAKINKWLGIKKKEEDKPRELLHGVEDMDILKRNLSYFEVTAAEELHPGMMMGYSEKNDTWMAFTEKSLAENDLVARFPALNLGDSYGRIVKKGGRVLIRLLYRGDIFVTNPAWNSPGNYKECGLFLTTYSAHVSHAKPLIFIPVGWVHLLVNSIENPFIQYGGVVWGNK